MTINQKLVDFFTDGFISGAIGLVGGSDPLSRAIRTAQSQITEDGGPSLWSHSFILGEMRRDLNSVSGRSPYIFESTISLSAAKFNIRNGAQENWIGKWCTEETEAASIIGFPLNNKEKDMVLATALQLVCEQIQYPIDALVKKWWEIVIGAKWQPPEFDIHALICSGLVRYCYQRARRDFLPSTLPFQSTTPEDIARAGKEQGRMVIYA